VIIDDSNSNISDDTFDNGDDSQTMLISNQIRTRKINRLYKDVDYGSMT